MKLTRILWPETAHNEIQCNNSPSQLLVLQDSICSPVPCPHTPQGISWAHRLCKPPAQPQVCATDSVSEIRCPLPPSLSPTKPHILISYSSKVQCHLTNIMLQISSKTIHWCLDTVPSSHLIQRGSTKTEEGEESKTNQPNKPHIYTHMIYTCT